MGGRIQEDMKPLLTTNLFHPFVTELIGRALIFLRLAKYEKSWHQVGFLEPFKCATYWSQFDFIGCQLSHISALVQFISQEAKALTSFASAGLWYCILTDLTRYLEKMLKYDLSLLSTLFLRPERPRTTKHYERAFGTANGFPEVWWGSQIQNIWNIQSTTSANFLNRFDFNVDTLYLDWGWLGSNARLRIPADTYCITAAGDPKQTATNE